MAVFYYRPKAPSEQRKHQKIQLSKGVLTMSKSTIEKRQEKITSYEEQIAQILNRKKAEIQRLKADERKARTKRLCQRHGLLESLMPELIDITDEQFKAFIEKAACNTYGRDILRKILNQPQPKQATQSSQSTQKQSTTQAGEQTNTKAKNQTNTAEQGAQPLPAFGKGALIHHPFGAVSCALPRACRCHGQRSGQSTPTKKPKCLMQTLKSL